MQGDGDLPLRRESRRIARGRRACAACEPRNPPAIASVSSTALERTLQGEISLLILPLAATLLASGLVAGFVAGLLGVGGGIVLVPVLFHVFTEFGIDEQVRMHLAVGTSLATIIFTAWRSVAAHRAREAVDDALLRAWVVPLLLGVALGSASARVLAGPALMTLFAVVALVVAFHMAFGRDEWRLADLPPAGTARQALGALIGMFSMLMGLGGGTLGVPIFTLLGVPIHRAVGTAAGLGLLIAIPGTLGWLWAGLGVPGRPPLSLGYVNAAGLVLIVPATMLTAPWGARLAHAVPRRALRRAFAVFLVLTSLRMLLELR